MTRPVWITGLLVSMLCPVASGARGVKIEGVFVRTGQLTPIAQINVGDPVQLIVRVSDVSDVQPQGVAGGKVDVTWNGNVLELLDDIDNTDDTTADVSPLFNQAIWTWAYSGQKNAASSLRNMGAAQGWPPKTFGGESEVFFVLNFNPIASGQANVTLKGHEFAVIPADPEAARADAEWYDVTSPVLEVLQSDGGAAQPAPPAPLAPGCFAQALAVGMLMVAGCAGTVSSRRQQRC